VAREKNPAPRCIGQLKDGSDCRSVAIKGPYCAFHSKQALKQASTASPPPVQAVEEQPATAAPGPLDTAVVAGTSCESTGEPIEDAEPRDSTPIASLRAALRGDLSTSTVADLMGEMLLEALRASKEVFSTCPACNRRHPVSIPDFGTRMKAAESLLEQIEGRLAQQSKSSEERIHEALNGKTRIEDLSNDELLLLTLEKEGPDWDLREDAQELARKVLVAGGAG
jgi:hypothetical protein